MHGRLTVRVGALPEAAQELWAARRWKPLSLPGVAKEMPCVGKERMDRWATNWEEEKKMLKTLKREQ